MGAGLLLAMAFAVLAVLGGEFAHRLWLFIDFYGFTRGANHVADGYFKLAYLAGGIGAAAALASWLFVRRRACLWAAGILAALILLLCLSFFVMHRTGVLVEYSQFVKGM